jgi:hypothetical protein
MKNYQPTGNVIIKVTFEMVIKYFWAWIKRGNIKHTNVHITYTEPVNPLPTKNRV